MAWFDNNSYEAQSYYKVQNAPHKATLSHEVIAGAAAYEAAKAYENHVASNGRPDSHAKAKEMVAGLTGAFIDRVVETKGLDYIDTQRAKYHARQQTHERLEVDYSSSTEYTSDVREYRGDEYGRDNYGRDEYIKEEYRRDDYSRDEFRRDDYSRANYSGDYY